jgi:23S rRNA (uracil1939-C5)-methyltransferase
MLPGETGVVEIRKRKGIFIGTLKELLNASPDRIQPIDSHYLSSSPWQCMTYPLQAALKDQMLAERYAYYSDAPKPEFVSAVMLAGYRTKMEFSVMNDSGALVLAVHQRGGGPKLLPAMEGSILASSEMNRGARGVVSLCGALGYNEKDLKAIVVRESKATRTLVGVVYLARDEDRFANVPMPDGFSGLIIVFSDPRSPASVATRVLREIGETKLKEDIGGKTFVYPWDAFFQNNIPMFERALRDMAEALIPGKSLLDLYAGVGTIGISLSAHVPSVQCVEIVDSAAQIIRTNAEGNRAENVAALRLPAERSPVTLLASCPNVIVDPPRAGLHPKVIAAILEALPRRLIYLSCNPETQARDYARLSSAYRIEKIIGYDFYPQTPHLESLLVLSVRSPV